MSAQRASPGNARTAPQPVSVSVSVSIERLVLDGFGFTPAQGAVVQRALEHELARLVERSGSRDGSAARVAWSGGAVPAATAPLVRLSGPAQPACLGRDIARSLFTAMGAKP